MNRKDIFGAFTLAIALFLFWPMVFGSWQEVGALRAAVGERQQLLDKRTAILTNSVSEYSKYQAAISGDAGRNFIQLVPVKKNTAELVSAIQDIAQSSGMQVSQVQIAEAKGKEAEPYKTLSLGLDMVGTYPTLRTFLGNLEKYVRILNVNSIQVSTDALTGQLRFTIRADSYFLK
jgi:Tfp pilus assembly protein PilO